MIDYSKIIIVTGLPRSGTSIVTRTLASHPDITLFADGTEIHVLENTLLPLWTDSKEDLDILEKIQNKCRTKYLLMKRPGILRKSKGDHISERFKDSLFVIMQRDFYGLKRSWNASRMVPRRMIDNIDSIYKDNNIRVEKFIRDNPEKRILYLLEDLQKNPKELFSLISSNLELENLFSTVLIKYKGRWDHSKHLRELFISGKAITNLNTNREKTLIGINNRMTKKEIEKIITI